MLTNLLYSSVGLCPRFYGSPKVHKLGIQWRLIVSFVNSPTHAISGYLARMLSLFVGNTDYAVKNSCEFCGFHMESGNVCVQRLPGSCQKFEVKQRNQNHSTL